MPVAVKICGLTSAEAVDAAVSFGAAMTGFVFFPPSPRSLEPDEAKRLVARVPDGVLKVGVLVDPDDDLLERILTVVPLDMVQLHGTETPARVAEIRSAISSPVMKAMRVAESADLDAVPAYEDVADYLLFDAKPPPNVTALPGGNGVPFDWTILAGRQWSRPWMLSGGLTAANLAESVRTTGAGAVDVSSGVEDRPGHKVPELVAEFLYRAAAIGEPAASAQAAESS